MLLRRGDDDDVIRRMNCAISPCHYVSVKHGPRKPISSHAKTLRACIPPGVARTLNVDTGMSNLPFSSVEATTALGGTTQADRGQLYHKGVTSKPYSTATSDLHGDILGA